MAIAIDQANVGEFVLDTSASSIALTTSNTVASGATIILTATFVSSVTATSCSGGGLTWTIDKQGVAANNAYIVVVSANAPSGLASGTTITLTLSGATTGGRSMCGTSFTGVVSSTPVDVAGTVQATSGTAWSTGNLTIAAGSVLVGLAAGFTTISTSTPTSPSIETHDVNGGGTSFAATTAYRIEASGGSVAVAGTWSTTQSGTAVGVAYKAAAGGGTKSIVTAAINATSAVTGAIQKLAAIKPAAVNATSAVTGSVAKLVHLAVASISATSAVTGTVVALRAVIPAAINATSAVTGAVAKLGTKVIVPAALNATSAVTASVQALRQIGGAVINATSNVTGTVTGPVQPALQFINRVIRWHRHR